MVGAICKLDVLTHPAVTIRCFGWRVFFKTLVARRDQTFLSILVAGNCVQRPTERVFEVIRRCADLELRAKHIYETLASRFAQFGRVKRFFEALARQEQEHADLLDLCRIAVTRGRWNGKQFDPWRDSVPRLEHQMRALEVCLEAIECVSEALRLVIEVESSEINDVFGGVVSATDSEFVREMGAFWGAQQKHISYICGAIPKLERSLSQACQELRQKYRQAAA
jgi:hypothetical protein